MPDILQQFLSLGLLDIGDDDTRLAKLRDAAADLQQRLVSEPRIAVYHALMVYSPNVGSGDSCFTEDSEVLLKHWPTYQNRHPDVPREIFRAISLQAVMAAAESSSAVQAATTYGLRSLEQHPVGQKEGSLLRELYVGLEAKLEADAVARWQANATALADAFAEVRVAAPQVREADAASALEIVVETIASETNRGLKELTDQVANALGTAQSKFRDVAISTAQRSELLWWKESLYSQSLGQSYRDVPSGVAAVFMVIDLCRQVGPITPLSVDFFLREAVREMLCENFSLSWGELVTQIASQDYMSRFLADTPSIPSRVGVKTIIEKLRDDLQTGGSQVQKSGKGGSKTGKAEPIIDLRKFAMKAFVALQALRVAAE
jgi:hypothetical protein